MPIIFGIYLVTDLTGVIHYISFIIQFQRGGLSQQASLSQHILMERVKKKSDKNLSGLCKLVRNLLKPTMGSSMSADQEDMHDQNFDFSYQVRSSIKDTSNKFHRIFSMIRMVTNSFHDFRLPCRTGSSRTMCQCRTCPA